MNNSIIIASMSGRLHIKPLLTRNAKTTELNLVSNSSSTFSAYDRDLQDNTSHIIKKYRHLDSNKVRALLEELDNNRDLAMDILDEEQSASSPALQERSSGRKLNLSKEEENSLLKQSFLSLYKKLMARSAEAEELRGKYERERQENERLRQVNRCLMEGGYGQAPWEDQPPIC